MARPFSSVLVIAERRPSLEALAETLDLADPPFVVVWLTAARRGPVYALDAGVSVRAPSAV